MKYSFFLYLTAFLFASCEMVVNVDIPEVPSKLVVIAFISPQDTIIQVKVTQSLPLFKPSTATNNLEITNATVTLIEGNTRINLPHREKGKYEIKATQFAITAGKTYLLEVVHPDGRKAVGKCTIPPTFNFNLQASITHDAQDRSMNNAEVSWIDDANSKNYYRLFAYERIRTGWDNQTDSTWQEQASFWYNDQNKQGKTFVEKWEQWRANGQDDLQVPYLFVLLHTDEAYQRYHVSIENAYYSEGNPFAEPAPLYTNIEGGLGVFAGYQRYDYKTYVKE